MSRTSLAALLILISAALPARAQFNFVGPGSTVQGDYLRGVGAAAFGMGIYNHQTAIAESINADTMMRVNEYIYESLMHENQVNAEYRNMIWKKHKEDYDKIQQRIKENPEARDVDKGSALNAVLEQINDPRIQESSSRAVAVPLTVDEVRRIPFKLGAKGVMRFSIARLTAKGKGKWPVAFQDNQFDHARRDFERALDNALEQQYKGAMQLSAIQALQKAVDSLEYTLEKVVGRIADKLYIEARERIKEMRATVEMLKVHAVESALGELDRYAGTTVDDLRRFMRKHNLQFADAGNPDERELFPELYGKLVAQKDKVSVGLPARDDEPKN
jgi:hypothetical protein